ncbi:MAG: FAD-dependent monooxygenase, partial [Pseudomonadota bacterium]
LALASNNIPSTIIEKKSCKDKSFFSDVRTTALTDSSRKFFEEIGIWNKISDFVGPINDIYVVDNKSPEMLHFASSELDNGEIMGYLIQNTDFKKKLYELVSSNKLINVIQNCSYEITENTEDGCSLTLNDGKEHKSDLLLVCDGRYSTARQQFFSSNIEKTYDQCALTFIVHHAKPHEGTAVEHFMPTGPFAILPLRDQKRSSIVWTVNADMKDLLENLPKDEFEEIVQDNFGEFLGKIEVEGKVAGFPLKAYETDKYFNKRIVLIADTAHIIHPLAGQGLNQGIKDISCFIELLSEYGITDLMLSQYQTMRKTDNSNMLEITDTINAIFSNKSKILQAGRSLGFQTIEKVPPFKKLLIKYAMGKR